MSTAPHLWRKLLDARAAGRAARRRRPVPQPHRARGRRAPAAAARHRRRAGDRDDAGDRRRRAAGRGVVPRAHRRLRRAARAARASTRSRTARRSAACRPRTSRASGASSPPRGPPCCGSASGPSATLGAPAAYSTIASLPALTGAWRDRGGGCSYIPLATAARASATTRSSARTCGPGPVRTINMSQLGDALTDPALDPPVKALVCWNSNPAAIAPDQERVLEGLRRDDLFVVVLEQFMTDTARARRRGPARHHPARAPRRACSPGATTT